MFFISQFLKSPLTIGAVCPSGMDLASTLARMACECPSQPTRLIVDLGAGTGVITRELLALGISPDAILALDISVRFECVFNRLCAPVSLCVADAKSLYSILTSRYPGIDGIAIISSLPLMIMKKGFILEIMNGIRRILIERGGFLLQYTYALWRHASLVQYGFSLASRSFVARNLPPALVEKYDIESHAKISH